MMDDAGDRAAEIVDLFARGGDGRNVGLHRVMQLVAKNEKGGILPTLANALVILTHDPTLAGSFGFDEFTSLAMIMRAPPPMEEGSPGLPGPYPRLWGAADVALVQAYLQRTHMHRTTTQTTEQAMLTVATANRYHPVRDWLKTLKWDGQPRINTWLTKAFGCPADDYHAAIGSKFVIAAVRRVRQPGCKFDQLPVLEGGQGIGKSRVCRALFGAAWYSDAIPEELGSRDAALALMGVWGLEFAEIQHLIRNEVEVIKAFLSRSTDRYRPPYERAYVERPRQGVLIGTTNSEDYLRDGSGNRRIWPVKCEFADVEWVIANRDQIWAEAAAREAANEAIWLTETDQQVSAMEQQVERMAEDAWTDQIMEWLIGKHEAKIADILRQCLQLGNDKMEKRQQMRVADILKSLGWKRGKGGAVGRRWTPPDRP